MEFIKTNLTDAYIIKLNPFEDHRGSFMRTFCKDQFEKHGLVSNFIQTNLSISKYKNTLRGMHLQKGESAEVKLIKCIRGSILDVVIDLRPDSPTYCQHFKVQLDEENHKMIYIPKGFAHGFLSLTDNSQIIYQVSNFYNPKKEQGIRWNDPLFNIEWPVENPIMSEKDQNYPDYKK